MYKDEKYFVKSFEEDFILKTLKGKKKINFQSIINILKNKIINPNTKSFEKESRLACTFLHKNYLKTYRSNGLIFQTSEKPFEVFPFDLALLTTSDKIVVQYYRIKNNLYEYYGRKLIKGFEKFKFNSPEDMFNKISSPEEAWKEVNFFRRQAGYKELSKSKYKLIQYNEVIFNKPIKIKPVAIFGYNKLSRDIARKYGLPHFTSAEKFYEHLE